MATDDAADQQGLEAALAGAQAADRFTRIQSRDRIAAHGIAAIDAVFEWAGDDEFGAGSRPRLPLRGRADTP